MAVLGQLCGSTLFHGLVAEAALEARGACALLAHPSTARTVVTQTMDTATIYREEMGTKKLDRKQGLLEAGVVLQSKGEGWEWSGYKTLFVI